VTLARFVVLSVSLTRKACCRYATKDAKSVRDAQIGEIVKSIEQHLQRASATHWGLVRNVVWAGIQQRRPRVTPLPPTVSQLSRTASENAAAGTYSDETSLEKLERDLQVLVASTQLTDSDRTRLKRVMTDILDWLVPTLPTPTRSTIGASEPRPAEPVRLEPEPSFDPEELDESNAPDEFEGIIPRDNQSAGGGGAL